jgi:hypothetical protein
MYNWTMPPSRYIRLTEEEDARLREIEQDPYLDPKVHLRAQVLRQSKTDITVCYAAETTQKEVRKNHSNE